MTNSKASGGRAITPTKINEITQGDTAPSSPEDGYLWVDTALSGAPIAKFYKSAAWQTFEPSVPIKLLARSTNPIDFNNASPNTAIVTISDLSVPTTSTLIATFRFDENSPAVLLGLSINGTIVNDDDGAGVFDPVYGMYADIGRRVTGTPRGFMHGDVDNLPIPIGLDAAIPSAIITSIALIGHSTGEVTLSEYSLWEVSSV